jgi:hypothetical protein
MKKLITYFAILLLFSCNSAKKEETKSESQDQDTVCNKTIQDIEPVDKEEPDTLSIFLEKPLDFYALKKKTRHMHSGGIIRISNHLFHSIDDDTYIFYDYWAIALDTANIKDRSLSFKVLKPWTEGTTERYYETDNEILIGIKSKISWFGLETCNFVGQTRNQVVERFGEPNSEEHSCLVYYRNDKLLILKLDSSKIVWFKYLWFNEDIHELLPLTEEAYKW